MPNNQIDYIEFKAPDLNAIKTFYSRCFGWKFTDYGTGYTAFSESGVLGGFELSKEPILKSVLVVLYHKNLAEIQQKIMENCGQISVDIFTFPGGRRFHFIDPAGNELAVWSDK
ncbi:VOC family protein [Winogradskyella sp.]|uniref:VOC family protein n=1 Tax=Winogradskyella sp. TaxID=1883156 RepID=UPI003513A293